MSDRYCDADAAAALNAPAPSAPEGPVTLTPAETYSLDSAAKEALSVLERMGATKDFRLSAAIRSAREHLTSAHASLTAATQRARASRSSNRGGAFLPPAPDGATPDP